MSDFGRLFLALAGMAFALATVSVVLSPQAQAGAVVTSGTSGVAKVISAAEAPV